MIKSNNSAEDNIISDLNLFKYKDGINFVWSSDNQEVVNIETGQINRQLEDTHLGLSVDMVNEDGTVNEYSSMDLMLVVKGDPNAQSDEEIVNEAYEYIKVENFF